MTADKRHTQTGSTLKRRPKFNPKRGPRPSVLARANRTVAWGASLIIAAFLLIVTVNALVH